MSTPSKKVTYFLICVTAIVTGIISYSAYQKKKPLQVEPEVAPANLAIVVNNHYESNDSDADGLLDWEETLWGTDPKNVDSDGDKTEDGQEVALSRNPNKAGPKDAWTSNNYIEEYIPTTDIDQNTLTARVAQSVLDAISDPNNDRSETTAALLKQIQDEIKVADIYKKENLITFSPADKEKMQKYADDFIRIPLKEGSLVLSQENVEERNYVDSYKKIALQLSVIPVPESITGLHTDFINNLNKMAIFTSITQEGEKDPIKVLAVIPEFTKVSDEQKLLLEQITNYMESNGIIFSTDE